MKRNVLVIVMLLFMIMLVCCNKDNIKEQIETYTYKEGIYPYKDSFDSDIGNTPSNGYAIPDKDSAVTRASEEFEKVKQAGFCQSYTLRSVFYDTEDEIWIVSFGEKKEDKENGIVIVGGSYEIAISKATGKILKMWPGE